MIQMHSSKAEELEYCISCNTESSGGSLDHTSQLQRSIRSDASERRDAVGPMADLNSSLESSGVSADETSTSAAAAHSTPSSCETMLWEGWNSQPNSTADEASTTLTQLPELVTSSSSRLSFHHQSDMLSTMLSHFNPLAAHTESEDHSPGSFFQESAESEGTVSFGGGMTNSAKNAYLSGIPCPLPSKREDLSHFLYSKSSGMPPLPMWQSLGPESPSSPLALHNAKWDGHGPWPGATSSATIQLLQDAIAENSQDAALQAELRSKRLELFPFGDRQQFHGDHHASRINLVPTAHNMHNEIHVHNNFGVPPISWPAASPEAYSIVESGSRASTRSQQFMNFVRIAQEQRPVECSDPDSGHIHGYGDYNQEKAVGLKSGRHRQLQGGEELNGPAPKRPHLQAIDHGAALWRNAHAHRSLCPPPASSQAMEIYAIGPALNTNGKPRARRGSATDPQSVYARHRREKINERLKTLQHLVPNGAKVDIVTMLDEAVHYVQFLQHQVQLLKSDKLWMHATPNIYKGIDLTNTPTQTQGMGPSA
ncbi:hypothetical protein M758_4G031100 [Ceratodon purpureus]|uniref:BHLH domain-containing protein n=1 Tax=Ceratodon purpureus TaxID=3225 RepID=A0A8T0I835_CERPU|nr:hypothetical protein KC19_4G034700 [Ceratodon purpureus]KAG0617994.1 hypothetical protein M758_4G031100 [Ceratodon purpureus]